MAWAIPWGAMDEPAFREALTHGGRSATAADRAVGYVEEFEAYLAHFGVTLDDAMPAHLKSFVADVEADSGASAKLNLWGIRYYYEFIDDPVMVYLATEMREQRVRESPFQLRQFPEVDQTACDRLRRAGFRDVGELLTAASTVVAREELSRRTGVAPATIDELARLSDLARVSGLNGIRARLYLRAGVGSVFDLALRESDVLATDLTQLITEAGLDALPPTRRELQRAVEAARRLPSLIEW